MRTKDLNRTSNAILDVQGSSRSGDTGIVTSFDHQTRIDLAGQSQTTVGMEIWNDDLALEDMHDVGIIPNRFAYKRTTAYSHAIEAVSAQAIVKHQWTVVTEPQVCLALIESCGPSKITYGLGV